MGPTITKRQVSLCSHKRKACGWTWTWGRCWARLPGAAVEGSPFCRSCDYGLDTAFEMRTPPSDWSCSFMPSENRCRKPQVKV